MPKKKKVENQSVPVVPEVLQVQRIYTDAIQISHSFYDFQILLGTMLPSGSGNSGESMIVPTNIVYMSPQHAKVFADLLNRQVESYEKKYDPIKLPAKLKTKK